MEPLIAATSFATIVGLLSNFKSESSGKSLSDFIDWLQEKRHEDIALSIQRNQSLTAQLTLLLSINHQELIQRLDCLDEVLSSVAMNVEFFSNLASAVRPNSILSSQAISIIKQFVDSQAREFWEHNGRDLNGTSYHLIGSSTQAQLKIEEPRFVEDDLSILVSLGFLRINFGNKGTKKFLITRQAVKLAESI